MSSESPHVSVVDILGSVPAEGAVFTTFTLSLAWFEVYLLRHLERQGARRVAVLADPTGIDQSLREGLARGPGLRYALEPVHVGQGGVFHPKVAFVWGRDRAVLAVGSGNLTLPGMQRNLEVWDVLLGGHPGVPAHQQISRRVAEHAAAFFDRLRGRLHEGAWSRSVLDDASAVMRGMAPRLVEDNGIRWLDSMDEPIGDQIVRLVGSAGAERTLQALSPFHHPDGASLRELAQRSECSDLEVLFTSGTTFPMAKGRAWGEPAVHGRRLPFAERPLHAKVFRFLDDVESVLVAGSANATHQALWTTKNVEVCLLRRGGRQDHDALLDGELGQPEQLPPTRIEQRAAPLSIDWARASDTGVRIRLAWRGPESERPRRVELAYVEHDDEALDLAWPHVAVEMPLPRNLDTMRPTPIRVEAVAAGDAGQRWVARGWVSFEGWLEASPRWRRAMVSWARLLQAEADDDEDDAELLRIFGEEHARSIGTLAAAPRRGGHATANSKDRDEVPVAVSLLTGAASRSWAPGETIALGEPSLSHISAATSAMLAVFRRLDEGRSDDAVGDDEQDGSDTSTAREPRDPRVDASVSAALDLFEERFVTACRAMTAVPKAPDQVLAYFGVCVRMAVRYRLRGKTGTAALWQSLDSLVRAVLGQRREGPPVLSLLKLPDPSGFEPVLSLLVGLVALLHWRNTGGRLDGEDAASGRPLRGGLREALATLERFAGPSLPVPVLPRQLLDRVPDGHMALETALSALAREEAPSSHATWLKKQVYRVSRGEVRPRDVVPSGGRKLEDDERRMLEDVLNRRVPKFVEPWVAVCPSCQMAVNATARQRLGTRLLARCSNTICNRWLLPSEPS